MRKFFSKSQKVAPVSPGCPDGYIAVYLPLDLVRREACRSPELADEDLAYLSNACLEAWNSYLNAE